MDYIKLYNFFGFMVIIDFEKVFDFLSWNFFFKILEKFNFGEFFIRWICFFYINIFSCIMNNGVVIFFFLIGRGVR